MGVWRMTCAGSNIGLIEAASQTAFTLPAQKNLRPCDSTVMNAIPPYSSELLGILQVANSVSTLLSHRAVDCSSHLGLLVTCYPAFVIFNLNLDGGGLASASEVGEEICVLQWSLHPY